MLCNGSSAVNGCHQKTMVWSQKHLNYRFFTYKHSFSLKMLIDGLQYDYGDVFLSAVWIHSDGTHSLHWTSDNAFFFYLVHVFTWVRLQVFGSFAEHIWYCFAGDVSLLWSTNDREQVCLYITVNRGGSLIVHLQLSQTDLEQSAPDTPTKTTAIQEADWYKDKVIFYNTNSTYCGLLWFNRK